MKDDIKKENISDINSKNQSIHNNENEEIKILIDNKEGKNKKEEIIKKANKIKKIEPKYEFQINDTMKKNKSLEKIMKDIFDSDKKRKIIIKKY